MRYFLSSVVSLFIIGLFLYSKLLPFESKLDANYRKGFKFFASILNPILSMMRGLVAPMEVGKGLAVDMSQIIVLVLLLLALNLIV